MNIVSWTFLVLCCDVYLNSAKNYPRRRYHHRFYGFARPDFLPPFPPPVPAHIEALVDNLSNAPGNSFRPNPLRAIKNTLIDENPFLGAIDPNCYRALPGCPNENIKFWLYDSDRPHTPTLLDPLNLQQANIVKRRPVKILIHGYTGDADASPNDEVRPVLLANQDVYVISVDYGPLVREPCYFAGVQNLQVVAECLGELINNLVEGGYVRNRDIHIIGFSLGGQAAGLTANFVNRPLKRITGLDPAKPMFAGVGVHRRIDPDDAEFVDVIHTDVMARGVLPAHGDIDFYPNLGRQPGCEQPSLKAAGRCNHFRAPAYYAESITSPHGFWGHYCPGWERYNSVFCDYDRKAEMGYHVNTSLTGTYFLDTAARSPFALGRDTP